MNYHCRTTPKAICCFKEHYKTVFCSSAQFITKSRNDVKECEEIKLYCNLANNRMLYEHIVLLFRYVVEQMYSSIQNTADMWCMVGKQKQISLSELTPDSKLKISLKHQLN